jgi:hypothetical protein
MEDIISNQYDMHISKLYQINVLLSNVYVIIKIYN